MERYQFNKEKHYHTLDGKPLIGVTTALGIIAKPALIGWASNMAVDFVAKSIKPDTEYRAEVLETIFKEARSAHRKKKEEAGAKGTDVHEEIEQIINAAIEHNQGYIIDALTEGEQVKKFVEWAKENKVRFLESEKNVWSETAWIGGIVDMIFEMDGKRMIGDVKTSSGIYNEHFFQMAAYDMCLEEMGEPKNDAYLVINLKKDGKMDLKITENKEINREAFKSALSLYKIINSLI